MLYQIDIFHFSYMFKPDHFWGLQQKTVQLLLLLFKLSLIQVGFVDFLFEYFFYDTNSHWSKNSKELQQKMGI